MELSSYLNFNSLNQCTDLSSDDIFVVQKDQYNVQKISYSKLSDQIYYDLYKSLESSLSASIYSKINEIYNNKFNYISTVIDSLSVDLYQKLSSQVVDNTNDISKCQTDIDENRSNINAISAVYDVVVSAIIKIANCQQNVKNLLSSVISGDLSVQLKSIE